MVPEMLPVLNVVVVYLTPEQCGLNFKGPLIRRLFQLTHRVQTCVVQGATVLHSTNTWGWVVRGLRRALPWLPQLSSPRHRAEQDTGLRSAGGRDEIQEGDWAVALSGEEHSPSGHGSRTWEWPRLGLGASRISGWGSGH